MINLSKTEKDFLKRIVDLSERTSNMFLGNLLDRDLVNIDVFLDYQRQTVEFKFDSHAFVNTDFVEMVRDMSWTLMKLVKLLKYLEEENYLYLYQESSPQNNSRFGQLTTNNPFISYQIYDPEISRLLLECSHRTIVVGQTLIDYVRNDFKTEEQLRHEQNIAIATQNLSIANSSLEKTEIGINLADKSIKLSTKAIVISIILGLISIGASFYIADKQSENATKIDNTQFDSINKSIVSIGSKIESSKMVPDTINAKVINAITIKK